MTINQTLELILEHICNCVKEGDSEKAAELALAYQRIKSVQTV